MNKVRRDVSIINIAAEALSFKTAAYPKYPPQPVVRCDGYRPRNDAHEAEPGDRSEAG